ncbi:hypothetical protein [Hymenobacter siberiensis]|uniref:hypothetical protein n=1 Tax=Hymenobacter siberiensis TaxID=2848396 RepID=UPI001C1E3D75|nr:hypothetical protein [Hymenobacter siberiensis]MBU6120672.1 hypothetical protein [Hymenobacter siberiensis]
MKKKPLLPPTTTPVVPDLAADAHEGTPEYGEFGEPSTEPAPEPAPDHRAEGGNVFDLRDEQTTL